MSIIDATARVRSARRVTLGGSVSLHDCAITERSVVLMDLPVTFSLDALGEGASFPYRWQEGYRSRFGLLPRDSQSTEVVWHDIEPCYVFHVMNAHDEPGGDGVVLDVVRHSSMFRTQLLGRARGRPRSSAGISMGTAAPSRKSASTIAGRSSPACDERVVGRPHRYGYAVAADQSDDIVGIQSALVCHDFERGTSVEQSCGAARVSARPSSSRGRMTPPRTTVGFLRWCIRPPTARRRCTFSTRRTHRRAAGDRRVPQRVPAGFHGNWVPDQR